MILDICVSENFFWATPKVEVGSDISSVPRVQEKCMLPYSMSSHKMYPNQKISDVSIIS